LNRFDVGKSQAYGRAGEKKALEILPTLGFSDIEDMCGYSNQFFVDFIATYQGERVLVDATIRLRHHIIEKVKLAKALRMKLFIIHVSPKTDGLFYLSQVPLNQSSVRVPAAFLRQAANPNGVTP